MPNKKTYHKNKEKYIKEAVIWNQKNSRRHYIINRLYLKRHPWMISYFALRQRCMNPNNERYNSYGARGIQVKITGIEMKKLWFRDKAYLMKCPTIDRLDNDGNYEYTNCQFIEKVDNKPYSEVKHKK